MPDNVGYPAKTRSAAVDRVMPARSRSEELDQTRRQIKRKGPTGGMKDPHKFKGRLKVK